MAAPAGVRQMKFQSTTGAEIAGAFIEEALFVEEVLADAGRAPSKMGSPPTVSNATPPAIAPAHATISGMRMGRSSFMIVSNPLGAQHARQVARPAYTRFLTSAYRSIRRFSQVCRHYHS
jgi:hypothetical protein